MDIFRGVVIVGPLGVMELVMQGTWEEVCRGVGVEKSGGGQDGIAAGIFQH